MGMQFIDSRMVDSVKIEKRCNGNVRNITVMVKPNKSDEEFGYASLVARAADLFLKVYGDNSGFEIADADVMAWSRRDSGIRSPYLYRVTVDFRRKGTDEGTDEGCDDDDDKTDAAPAKDDDDDNGYF